MKELRLKIQGIDTIEGCLSVDNSSTYTDSIVKDLPYTNIAGRKIRVTNTCNTAFSLSARTVFTQSDAFGSTFTASINTTVVPPNSYVDMTVYYNGIYKSTDLAPFYTFTINNKVVQYALTITVIPPADIPGTLENFSISRANRQDYNFTIADFVNHHHDDNGDTVTDVLFSGDVSTISYDSQAYVANTWVAIANANKFKFMAPSTDALITTTLTYKVRDSKGNTVA